MPGDFLRVRFQLRADDRLARFVGAGDRFGTIELDNAIYAGAGQWFEYLTFVGGETDPEMTLDTRSAIEVLDCWTVGGDPPVYHAVLFVDEVPEFVLSEITRCRALPHRILLEDDRLRVVATVRDWNHLKEFANDLERTYAGFELLGTEQIDDIGFPLGGNDLKHTVHGKLTPDQLLVLEVAYRMGYFRVPQEATGKEIAEQLETSQSAISERLRNAQQRLLSVLFGSQL
ncbi:helix-turn-helix domain-containing protein [Halosolutus halophilus]|uniref:helix-turn-helix domain-containing protein n=1 Tax=Halosolutus halophilus TaxID=1552990 RepID=UPI002234F023|nr:helix-turn-helix domain-containing protein [Halosolutus halophilus]